VTGRRNQYVGDCGKGTVWNQVEAALLPPEGMQLDSYIRAYADTEQCEMMLTMADQDFAAINTTIVTVIRDRAIDFKLRWISANTAHGQISGALSCRYGVLYVRWYFYTVPPSRWKQGSEFSATDFGVALCAWR